MVEFSSETIWDRRFPLRPSLWSITLRSRRFRFRAVETILLSLLLIFTSISLWSENTFLHFTFVEVCLVTQYIIDLGICSVHTWKQCIFCSTGWSIPETIRSYRLGVLFSSSIFLLLFSLLVRLVVKKRVLKSSAIIVGVSISYFNSVSLCFTCFATLYQYIHTQDSYVFWWVNPVVCLFLSLWQFYFLWNQLYLIWV